MPGDEHPSTGQVIVVTGGARGIGDAIIGEFIANGFRAVSLDLGEPEAPRARARYLHADVTSLEAVEAAFADIDAHEGRVDVLVNNAGHPAPGPHGPHRPSALATGGRSAPVRHVPLLARGTSTDAATPLRCHHLARLSDVIRRDAGARTVHRGKGRASRLSPGRWPTNTPRRVSGSMPSRPVPSGPSWSSRGSRMDPRA